MDICVTPILADGVAKSASADDASSTVKSDALGTLEGTVIYEADRARRWRYSRYYIKDRRKGALAEAVVALEGRSLTRGNAGHGKGDVKTVEIDQKDHQFVPETVAIRAGDRVRFLNSDHALHNVASYHPLHSFNVNMPVGDKHVETFKRAGGIANPYQLKCGYHSAMRAWVYVFKHTCFDLTEEDGRYKLEKIPPGKYVLKMVHPAGKLIWSKPIEMKAGKTMALDIRVSPDNLQKEPAK